MQYIPGQSLYGSEDSVTKKTPYVGFSAPEIVSSSPNPWWEEFYQEMNQQIVCMNNKTKTFGDNIRVHHAKQYGSLEGMLQHLRYIYDHPSFSSYPHPHFNTSLKLWGEVRSRFDERKLFLNPFLEQLFFSEKTRYIPPEGKFFLFFIFIFIFYYFFFLFLFFPHFNFFFIKIKGYIVKESGGVQPSKKHCVIL